MNIFFYIKLRNLVMIQYQKKLSQVYPKNELVNFTLFAIERLSIQ